MRLVPKADVLGARLIIKESVAQVPLLQRQESAQGVVTVPPPSP